MGLNFSNLNSTGEGEWKFTRRGRENSLTRNYKNECLTVLSYANA